MSRRHPPLALALAALSLGCGAATPARDGAGGASGAVASGGGRAPGEAGGAATAGLGSSVGGAQPAGGVGAAGTGAAGAAGAAAGTMNAGGAGQGGSGAQAEAGGAGMAASTGGARAGSGGRGPGGRSNGGNASIAGASGAGASGAGAAAGGSAGATASTPLTVYLAGDSTVQNYADTASPNDQAGWGQMLGALFAPGVTVDNRAVGGRTARRFIDDGTLDAILSDIEPGDSLFVQFGTNDGNKTATYDLDGETIPYYLDPETDFKTYLQKYIDGARAHEASPVFVTPPPRNSAYCTGGNGTGAHAQAMRELGMASSVPVLDLNQKAVDYLKAICPAPTPEDFFLVKSDMSVDGTHFQENGARILAGFVADEMRRVGLPLAPLLK